jgi:hypothetical protein
MRKLLLIIGLLLCLLPVKAGWNGCAAGFCNIAVSGGGTPTTIFTPTVALNADDTNANSSFRMLYVTSANAASSISATFNASSVAALSASHMSFCKWDGTASPACTTIPIELTSTCPGNTAGSGFSISAGASCTSNFVSIGGAFTLTAGDTIIIITDVSANGGERFTASGVTNSSLSFAGGGSTSWNSQAPGGYSGPTSGINYIVSQVQTQ